MSEEIVEKTPAAIVVDALEELEPSEFVGELRSRYSELVFKTLGLKPSEFNRLKEFDSLYGGNSLSDVLCFLAATPDPQRTAIAEYINAGKSWTIPNLIKLRHFSPELIDVFKRNFRFDLSVISLLSMATLCRLHPDQLNRLLACPGLRRSVELIHRAEIKELMEYANSTEPISGL